MASLAYGASRGRKAASNYVVEEVLAEGGAALVRWKLDTGMCASLIYNGFTCFALPGLLLDGCMF